MSLLKPTVRMPFHIDFDWWEQNDSDWHVFLRSLLCPEHQESLADVQEGAMIDWVDPRTAEVQQVDGIQHALKRRVVRLRLAPEITNVLRQHLHERLDSVDGRVSWGVVVQHFFFRPRS